MKKIFLSSLVVTGVFLTTLMGSRAFFSDTETSTGNTFEAGALDLKVDNSSYYNGATSSATTWGLSDLPGHLFFDFTDIKPDDWGEDTISLHVENDAYACMSITKTEDDDVSCTEPELSDDPTCTEPDSDLADGELGQQLLFLFWPDDGDNVLETNETVFKQGQANTLFTGAIWTLADSLSNIWGATPSGMLGGQTYYIAKAWCFGTSLQAVPLAQDGLGANSPTTPANSTGGVDCDGTSLNNAAQSDKFMADVEFTAIQKRHNTSFRCEPSASPSPTPSISPSPTPLACGQADVMLVLDRSGSISSSELTDLKTASKDFVDALGLSTAGIHAGFSSFATTGSLNQHLVDDGPTVKTAIDALAAVGFTNLKEGIDLAKGELGGGDGHDRAEPGSPDKMVIVTDGHPNRPLPSSTAPAAGKAAADAARAAGAEIFVVGVGSDVNAAYLQTIADNAAHYYSAANYSGLQTLLQNLDLCDQTP